MTSLRWLPAAAVLLTIACGDSPDDFGPDAGAAPDGGELGTDAGSDGGAPDGGPLDGGPPPAPRIDRPHAGGEPNAIAIAGSRVFLATGPTLTAWDLTDVRAPVRLGAIGPFEGNVMAIALSDDGHAFLAEEYEAKSRLRVLDVTDPAAMRSVATVDDYATGFMRATSVALRGDTLYFGDSQHGIFVFDVTDPAHPTMRRDDFVGAYPTGLRIVGDRLYYIQRGFIGTSLGALDLANDLAPLGSFGLPMGNATKITDDHAVLSISVYGFEVIDARDMSAPKSVFSDEEAKGFRVETIGDVALVPTDSGLRVYDVSDVENIVRTTTLEDVVIRQARASVAAGGRVIFTDALMRAHVLDAPSAAAVARAATWSWPGCSDCTAVDRADGRWITASFYDGVDSLAQRDLSLAGRAYVGDFHALEDVVRRGEYVFIADWAYGLRVARLAADGGIELVGGLQSPGDLSGPRPSSIAIDGDVLYLGHSTNGGVIHRIDISDPARPSRIEEMEGPAKVRDLAIANGHLFVADEGSGGPTGGVLIIDVRDPSRLRDVGRYDSGCSSAIGVDVLGDRMAVACSEGGFHLVDVSQPNNPRRLARWPTPEPSSPWSVALHGTRMIGGHGGGIVVVDVSDPDSPSLVFEAPTSGTVRDVYAGDDGLVVAAAALGGLYQWLVP